MIFWIEKLKFQDEEFIIQNLKGIISETHVKCQYEWMFNVIISRHSETVKGEC